MSTPIPLLRRVGDAALTVTAIVGALCLVGVLASLVFHLRPVVVRSGSMSPTIDTGSLAMTHKVAADDLRVGQIVTVPQGDSRVTHRIATITRNHDQATLRLKGDANPTPDADLHRVTSAYRYWFSVPLLGYVIAFLSTPPGVYLLAAFVALMIGLALRSNRPRRDGGRGHRSGRGTRAARTGAVSGSALMMVGALAVPSWAAWSDSATVNGTSLAAYTVPKPATPASNACTVNNPVLEGKTITTTWVVPTPPAGHALTYTAVLREIGAALNVVPGSGTDSTTVNTSLLTLTLGQDYHIDVTVTLSGSSWTASSTRVATLGLLGLGWSCGSWT